MVSVLKFRVSLFVERNASAVRALNHLQFNRQKSETNWAEKKYFRLIL